MARTTLVWYWPRNKDAARAVAESLPGAKLRSLKGWSGYVEEPADVVVMDDAPDAMAAYRAAGADVRPLSGGAVPEAVEEKAPPLPDGYEVVRAGPWYKVLDASGSQVGGAKRTEAEAIAQVT